MQVSIMAMNVLLPFTALLVLPLLHLALLEHTALFLEASQCLIAHCVLRTRLILGLVKMLVFLVVPVLIQILEL